MRENTRPMKIYMCLGAVPDLWLGPRTAEHAPGDRWAWICAVAPTKQELLAKLELHGYAPKLARRLVLAMRVVTQPIEPRDSIDSPHRSGLQALLDSGVIGTGETGVYVWEDQTSGTIVTRLQPRSQVETVGKFERDGVPSPVG